MKCPRDIDEITLNHSVAVSDSRNKADDQKCQAATALAVRRTDDLLAYLSSAIRNVRRVVANSANW